MEQLRREETWEAELLVVAPSFNRRQKWRFRDGRRPFNAAIQDKRFLDQVANGEAQFASGDTMVCRMRTRYVPSANAIRREHAVEQVLKHVSGESDRRTVS